MAPGGMKAVEVNGRRSDLQLQRAFHASIAAAGT